MDANDLLEKSVIGRFSQMNPQEFERVIDERWNVVKTLTDTIKESVRSESLSPIEGVKIAACAAGTVFGYDEFHPHSALNPWTLALSQGVGAGQYQSNDQRSPVGGRS